MDIFQNFLKNREKIFDFPKKTGKKFINYKPAEKSV